MDKPDLIFGVIGHRDLIEGDKKRLKEEVFTILKKYNKYSHIIVLSALAEGADMLVAQVAKEIKIRLHVVLPYVENVYLDSFADIKARDTFADIKAYASEVKVLHCNKKDEGSSICYQRVGEYIADRSNILIALWDGVDNGKLGGTSAIVRYIQADELSINELFIINTPRASKE